MFRRPHPGGARVTAKVPAFSYVWLTFVDPASRPNEVRVPSPIDDHVPDVRGCGDGHTNLGRLAGWSGRRRQGDAGPFRETDGEGRLLPAARAVTVDCRLVARRVVATPLASVRAELADS